MNTRELEERTDYASFMARLHGNSESAELGLPQDLALAPVQEVEAAQSANEIYERQFESLMIFLIASHLRSFGEEPRDLMVVNMNLAMSLYHMVANSPSARADGKMNGKRNAMLAVMQVLGIPVPPPFVSLSKDILAPASIGCSSEPTTPPVSQMTSAFSSLSIENVPASVPPVPSQPVKRTHDDAHLAAIEDVCARLNGFADLGRGGEIDSSSAPSGAKRVRKMPDVTSGAVLGPAQTHAAEGSKPKLTGRVPSVPGTASQPRPKKRRRAGKT